MTDTNRKRELVASAKASAERVLALVGSPKWMRVAAKRVLVLAEVAERLLASLPVEPPLFQEWASEEWKWTLASLPVEPQPGFREQPGFQEFMKMLASMETVEREMGEDTTARERQLEPQKFAFASSLNFVARLLLDSDRAEDHIAHWEELYELRISDGQTKARILYVRDVLVSLWPVAKWVFHRAVVAGILKHYFPAVETITRLFRF
jgi:hypothetical protein